MEKTAVDRIITEYVPKIYGFALSKTGDSHAADELASDITYEVYMSLLKAAEIYNVNSYIWRISSYVYARYVDKARRHREQNGLSVDMLEFTVNTEGGKLPEGLVDRDDPARLYREVEDRAMHEENLKRLRREIAYLGETQRKIIVAHYLHGQTVRETAATLGLPEGTVKWHLHDARNTIKEGMKMERNKGTLGYNPIKLVGLGHGGTPGPTGDTSAHLATRIAQNIAYAAYDKPKTEAEIAEELGVSPLYLDEFIKDLEEYAFLTRLPDGRLRTDILISRSTKESLEAAHEAKKRMAADVGEKFFGQMVANIDAYMDTHRDTLYIPDGDRNLWRWAAFMLAWQQYTVRSMETMCPALAARWQQFNYKRPDGGEYIAFARLDAPCDLNFNLDDFIFCGFMYRGSDGTHDGSLIQSVQCGSRFDPRDDDWEDNRHSDYTALYDCYTGHLPEVPANTEAYKRLFDRGLVVRRDGQISVNIPVISDDFSSLDLFKGLDMGELEEVCRIHGERLGDIEAPLYPRHMQDCVRAQNLAYPGTHLIYFCEWMLEHGYLTVPEGDRRGGLMTLLYANRLPEG